MNYEKFKKKCEDKTSVWHYFLRAEDGQSGRCNACQKIIRCHGGTTTGLRVHLKSAHSIDINLKPTITTITEANDSTSQPSISKETSVSAINRKRSSCAAASISRDSLAKKQKITDFFHSSQSMEATVSRMVALDGSPFRTFCTSQDQRRLFLNSGYPLPKTPTGIKNIVMNYSKQEKKKLVDELKYLLASEEKFSLSFDEWTSTRNTRYININLHYRKEFADGSSFKNLGLVRITGSMPAETCIRLLKEKLTEFGLSLDGDIIAVVTDGASVMLKVGRSIKAYHQVCLAHGIQLAVLDVMYKKNAVDLNETEVQDSDQSSDEDEDGGLQFITVPSTNSCTLITDYKSLIEKVRSVVKLFRNSPVKNDMFLQKHVKQDVGKELQLLIDCKTRWGSIATMVERFNRIRSSVSKALIDMKSHHKFTENEFDTLDSIQNSLNIIKVTVEALCRRDASLLTADAALKFMLHKLDSQKSTLANLLLKSLRERISQRRLSIASVLQYLQNPENYFTEVNSEEVFPKLNNSEMVEEIFVLTQRFQPDSMVEDSMVFMESPSSPSSVIGDGENQNFALELNKAIEKSLKEKKTNVFSRNEGTDEDGDNDEGGFEDKRKLIRIEMVLFENGGNRGFYLERAYRYLLNIPPTSVESERAFSSAAYTCNKIRSSLKDSTLDAISFLRSLFQQARAHSKM